jgi:geranylgeranyl pyrophosphate synthase
MLEILKGMDIEKDLVRLEDILQGAIRSDEPQLSRMSGHILFSEGQRIRPAIALTTYKACWGRNSEEVLPITAALEIIHTATMIHEDLIHKAPTHMGAPSLHKMFGKNEAIITADFLFAKAFVLCKTYGPDVTTMVDHACARLAEGEVMELNSNINKVTIESYIETITKKNAGVFSTATKLAAWIARAPAARLESMELMGQYQGIAHQMVDDYLDLGGSVCLPEPRGTEILLGKVTLPIIRARDQLSVKARKQLVDIYRKRKRDKTDVKRVQKLVSSTDGLEFTKKKAEELIEIAIGEIEKLDTDTHRKILMDLSRNIVERCN